MLAAGLEGRASPSHLVSADGCEGIAVALRRRPPMLTTRSFLAAACRERFWDSERWGTWMPTATFGDHDSQLALGFEQRMPDQVGGLNRKTNRQLAEIHSRHRTDPYALQLLIRVLRPRTGPLAVATLALVEHDLQALNSLGPSNAPTVPTSVRSPRPARMWKTISAATLMTAVAIGIAQAAGGQLWSAAWPRISELFRLLGLPF